VTLDFVRAIATLLVIAVALYAYSMAILGRRPEASSALPQPSLNFVFLIACLNEARVIGGTLESLLAVRGRATARSGQFHVVVVDDASDDGSPTVVSAFPSSLVSLIERRAPKARLGKGAALNHGYNEILLRGITAGWSPENTIVVVFDADTRAPPDFLERIAPLFADPRVIGVQSAVRMYNGQRNWVTFCQDVEFAVWARVFSRAKDRLGSATLGGNGQCVRLSALLSLGRSPWRPSLTEDLDLSLRLLMRGGRIRFCDATHVAQEAVPTVRQLVRQRARWVQGHLVTWEHLPAILSSPLPLRVRLDLAVLLLLPAALVPLGLATLEGWRSLVQGFGALSLQGVTAWYVLAFATAPLTAWALIRETGTGKPRAIVQTHLFVAYSVLWILAAARAIWSILRGDRAWTKTSRTASSSGARDWRRARSEGWRPRSGPAAGYRPRVTVAGTLAALVVLGSTLLLASAVAAATGAYQEALGSAPPSASP
jgi:cellulose synthase/poly-beta-1,6-N-acetylglucosamine synthase-like glycosyltransferase